jgi:hypothetical protein
MIFAPSKTLNGYDRVIHDRLIKPPQDMSDAQRQLYAFLVRERPYRLPKNYPRWSEVSREIATIAASVGDRNGRSHHREIWRSWIDDHAPIYCISKELIRQFELTSLDGIEGLLGDGWIPPLPRFLLALPNHVYRPGLQDSPIQLIAMDFADAPSVIRWSAIDTECTAWGAYGAIEQSSELTQNSINFSGVGRVDQISGLVLQSALAMAFVPDLIEAEEPAKSRKMGQNAKQKDRFLTPRWIGKDFVRPKAVNKPQGGHHASPQTHWRRGHWRNQAIGEGRQKRSLVWIRPTLING